MMKLILSRSITDNSLFVFISCNIARRNCRGDDRLYVSESNISFPFVKDLYKNDRNYDIEVVFQSSGLCGRVLLASDSVNCGGCVH